MERGVEQMRLLGQQVQHSTQEQRNESRLIMRSVEVVVERIQNILTATVEQKKEGDHIVGALDVFQEVTLQSNQRGDEMRDNLIELSKRSADLEEEIGHFDVFQLERFRAQGGHLGGEIQMSADVERSAEDHGVVT